MKTLRLCDELLLPLDAITSTFAVLSIRGAGKSNLAAALAEEMFSAGLPFVVVDPVGSWWGLRSSGDGKGPGLAVLIFGGRHGDVPLEKTGGQLIADLVVDQRFSCVLDVSEFSEGDKIRFLIDFAERLYRRNQDPLHLFLEEADDYCPQRPFREQARLLRAWENIVRRGRARGLGITMISQRSASLNKSVLTQIETLFVLRTTSPQDRKAIQGWVEHHGQSKELLDSLPSLGAGEAWCWSPQWLGTLKRVQIRRRSTFDSGATPKDIKGSRPPAKLADVDLGSIQKEMAATIERAKADDPRELRKRIADLQRDIKAARAQKTPEFTPTRVEVPVLKEGHLKRLESVSAALVKVSGEISEALKRVANGHRALPPPIAAAKPRPSPRPEPPKGGAQRRDSGDRVSLPRAQRKILDALAWLEGVGIAVPDKTQACLFAGLSPGAGHTTNQVGALRTAGLLDYPTPGAVSLTEEGRSIADASDVPQSAEAMHEQLFRKLPGAQRSILKVLIQAYPEALSKDDASLQAGLSVGAGHTTNQFGRLRSLGLIDYPSPGRVVALPVLFLEGR